MEKKGTNMNFLNREKNFFSELSSGLDGFKKLRSKSEAINLGFNQRQNEVPPSYSVFLETSASAKGLERGLSSLSFRHPKRVFPSENKVVINFLTNLTPTVFVPYIRTSTLT